jgi:hypothetical protein
MKNGEGGLSLLDDVQRIQNVCQIKETLEIEEIFDFVI